MKFAAPCLFAATLLALASCTRRENPIRHYQEITIEPAARTAPADTPARADIKLTWTCPAGWAEQPASNMRLATFLVGPEKTECTIVRFPGDAGGVQANVKRWLGQLHLDVDDDTLDAFLRKQPAITTQGGFPCTMFDFSDLPVKGSAGAPTMLAGMAAVGGQTVFVKLTGPAPLLAQEKDKFTALCQSLDGPHE